MKIITWNTNFWWNHNRVDGWKDNIRHYLSELKYDFLLLQEINPLIIFDIDSEENQFEINNDIVYFNPFLLDEIGAKKGEDIIRWGNSIIANKKYTLLKNKDIKKMDMNDFIEQSVNKKAFNGNMNTFNMDSYYFGKSSFMCYDFLLKDNKNITLINYYNKKNKDHYPMPDNVILTIEEIIKNKKENLIILAGDFNSDKERDPENKWFFENLSQLGLVNCTDSKEFETTMVPEIDEKRQYPNDKIFINEPYAKYAECKLIENTNIDLSDHRPIECITAVRFNHKNPSSMS
jgi:hypothetical protein